jgi:hypothetical protein
VDRASECRVAVEAAGVPILTAFMGYRACPT